MEVKTRFAPSPTGSMHIGSVRTALYAFLLARKNQGTFSLRIEDTDQARLVKGSVEDIIETLNWLGLKFDGEIIYQSQRLEVYKEYAQKLVDQNFAYENMGAIYFKTQKEGSTSWHDLVGGKDITFPNNTQEDFVILKSDGYPTYNFANVVDDHLMKITHTIRGNEFVSSTPKHLMLYEAFGWQVPQFAHMAVLVGTDRVKLSKRHGAKSALEFKKEGFLPEAIINFLALLGWSHPEGKEIFDLQEMIKLFNFNDFNQSSPYVDVTKLEWLNGEYIRAMSDGELTKRLQDYLVDHPNKDKIGPVIPLIKERIKKLSDFVPLTDFLWEKPEYDKEIFDKIISSHPERSEGSHDLKNLLREILGRIEEMDKPWKADTFERTFRDLAEELNIKAGEIFQLIRVAVSGQLVTPPLFESIQILGEGDVVGRVKQALQFL